MARTTKQLSGGGKDKFLRGMIAAEPKITAEAAASLGDALCSAISDVRVRRDIWEPFRNATDGDASLLSATTQRMPAAQANQQTVVAPEAAATFDPFEFSALAVLTKQGPAALAKRLEGVGRAADLHALAKAQHLAIDAALIDPSTLRAVIIQATEGRLAERRAAAS